MTPVLQMSHRGLYAPVSAITSGAKNRIEYKKRRKEEEKEKKRKEKRKRKNEFERYIYKQRNPCTKKGGIYIYIYINTREDGGKRKGRS